MKLNITLLLVLSALTLSCNSKAPEEKQENTVTEKPVDDNAYETLRYKALTITPEELGLSLPKDSVTVYGVVIDWGISDQIATVTAYKTGDASLYISSGGGVLGGGQYQNVSIAAKDLTAIAYDFIDGEPVIKMPLPATGNVAFYILTNNGIFSRYEEMKNFEDGTSPLMPLFQEANKVLGELRSVSEN